MSSANKDEGLKCLAIARRALADGNVPKALRFAVKAKSLVADPEIEQLLQELEGMADTASETPSTTRAPSPTPSAASTDTTTTTTGRRTTAATTSDQHQLVKKIRSKKCHYEVLMISKTAGDEEIKRAYRKLALKLHPDKNKAPGADEAFKMVSKAFSVLSNPQDRAHYDRYGDTEGVPRGTGGFGGFGSAGPGYATSFNGVQVDAEELFRMFFGGNPFMGAGFGGMGPQQRNRQQQYRQQQYRQQQYRQQQNWRQQQQGYQQPQQQSSLLRLLISIAPIIMLLFFNLFSRGPAPYSLSQTRDYPFAATTSAHRVPFYVADKAMFGKQYRPGSHERRILEHEIETSWTEITRRKCTQQQLVRARWVSYNQPEKAARAPLNYCEELESRFST